MTASQFNGAAGVSTGATAPPQSGPDAASRQQVLRNLHRPNTVPKLTREQKTSLRRHRTPVKDAFAAKGSTATDIDTAERDETVRSIQGRLNSSI